MTSLSRTLWMENADLAEASLAHPFVRGLRDGTLAREVFAGYVAQDAFFLEAFIRAYALALAHAPDHAGMEGLLDRYADDHATARLTYRRAMRLELEFFDSAHRIADDNRPGSERAGREAGLDDEIDVPAARLRGEM